MIDLTEDLSQLVHSLERTRPDTGRGWVILFTAPNRHAGLSLITREFARLAARKSQRGVWLYDLDFLANSQYRAFAAPGMVRKFGPPGAPLDASLNKDAFWKFDNETDAKSALTLHRVGRSRLFVSRFNARAAAPGTRIKVRAAHDYWEAVRDVVDLAVIDAPSPERSRAGFALYGEADAVVFVVDGTEKSAEQAHVLAEEVEARGGLPAGLVVNQLARPRRAA